MNGGYVTFDCTGIDLSKTSDHPDVSGIYDKAKDVISKGKPIYATNIVYSRLSEKTTASPAYIFYKEDFSKIEVYVAGFCINIGTDDSIRITSF